MYKVLAFSEQSKKQAARAHLYSHSSLLYEALCHSVLLPFSVMSLNSFCCALCISTLHFLWIFFFSYMQLCESKTWGLTTFCLYYLLAHCITSLYGTHY